MDKWVITNWAFFFFVTFSPFLWVYLRQVPNEAQIDIAFMNGMITASGIFFALITSYAAIHRNGLPKDLVVMLLANWGLLFLAGNRLFDSAIGSAGRVSALAWIAASFNANSWTAVGLLVYQTFRKPSRAV